MCPWRKPQLLSGLCLVGLFLVASGCGSGSGTPAGPPSSEKPDTLLIQVEMPDNAPAKPAQTLRKVNLVQQLYLTTYALSALPDNLACTMEVGPHYTLTFRQGTKTLATVLAKREGCRPVSVSGESQDRQATTTFWNQLDQSLQNVTPSR